MLLLRNVLSLIPSEDYTWAFEPGKSVPQMARLHEGHPLVVSLDIKDYFPSIRVNTIQSILISNGASSVVARVIAELLTYKYYLPQGAVTSPKVSNLVASHLFGPSLSEEFSAEQGYVMTIYADDVTISATGSHPEVRDILPRENAIGRLKQLGYELCRRATRIISREGFTVNQGKTKVMPYNTRQWVCGIVVNDHANLLYKSRKQLRAIVHNCDVHGLDSQAERAGVAKQKFIESLRGRLNWFSRVNPGLGVPLYDKFQDVVRREQETIENLQERSEEANITLSE